MGRWPAQLLHISLWPGSLVCFEVKQVFLGSKGVERDVCLREHGFIQSVNTSRDNVSIPLKWGDEPDSKKVPISGGEVSKCSSFYKVSVSEYFSAVVIRKYF